MEYEDEEQKGGLLQRIQESPRTVSALIIILIVAAAIYAFSGDEIDPTQELADTGNNIEDVIDGDDENDEEETPGEDTQDGEDENGEDTSDENTQDGEEEEGDVNGDSDEATATPTPTDSDQLEEEAKELPEATKTDQGFVEVAQSGEGITHLARKATTRWLSENSPEYTVTQEHRVYIEDYVQDRIGSEGLNLGETRTISFELMQEAVAAAGQLNDQQLENLSQYTSAL